MVKIKWLVGGRSIPNVGPAVIGKSATVPDDVANDLIAQGLAEHAGKVKPEPPKIDGLSKQELAAEILSFGIDPSDAASKGELKEQLKNLRKGEN